MSASPPARLIGLGLRRALPPAWVAASAVLALLVAGIDWGPDAMLAPLLDARDAGALRADLTRRGVWAVLLPALVVPMILRVAGTLPRWRAGEGDWLLGTPASRLGLVGAAWSGAAGAALLAILATGLVASWAAGGTAGALRRVATVEAPPSTTVGDGSPLVWSVEPPRGELPEGARLRFGVARVAGPPAVVLRLEATRVGGERAGRTSEIGLAGRGSLDVALPPGEGPLQMRLEVLGDKALVLLAGGGPELLVPGPRGSAASLPLALRAFLAVAAWLALALGLGGWMGAGTAAALAVSLALAPALAGAEPAWIPGAGLPAAIDGIGRGALPGWPAARAFAAAAALSAAGLLLARISPAARGAAR